jgi:ParB family chromosome partitioning protein
MSQQQHGLGRGLASLIPQNKITPVTRVTADAPVPPAVAPMSQTPQEPVSEEGRGQRVLEVPLERIVPNPHQPRLYFSEEKLEELAQSIREHGVLQPLTVTRKGENYELIAGERRFQASKKAGLTTVPVIVRDAEEQQKFELAIIENVQRHDLNPIEEAKAYKRLTEEFGMSQEVVAKKMGKSRSAVANILRLLQLPVEIQRAVAEEKISEGHAKALLSIENPEKQRALFEMIVKNNLTVREAESKAREVSVKPHKRVTVADPAVKEKEERLAEIFGTKVKISKVGRGGRIVIEYYGDEDLDHLMQKLAQ